MERLRRLAGGKLQSDDLETLEKVFDLVARQPWFDPSEYSAEGFALRLIALYRCGLTNLGHLEKIALLWAMVDFRRDMTNDQRTKLIASYKATWSPDGNLPQPDSSRTVKRD